MGKFGATSNGNKEELSLTASDKDRAKPKKISSTKCTALVAGIAEPVGGGGGQGGAPLPDFGRSVNPISTSQGGRLYHSH